MTYCPANLNGRDLWYKGFGVGKGHAVLMPADDFIRVREHITMMGRQHLFSHVKLSEAGFPNVLIGAGTPAVLSPSGRSGSVRIADILEGVVRP